MISNSIEETIEIGVNLGRKLKKGDCVALVGELGAGKTVFTKGVAKGLNVKDVRYVNSPTFVTIKEYKGRMPMYHFDLYRLGEPSSFDSLSFEEYFYGDGVTVIEWAERIQKLLPPKRIEVRISVAGENKRQIKIANK